MTLHRAHIPTSYIQMASVGANIQLPKETLHRLRNVLRIPPKIEIELFDGHGLLVRGTFELDGKFSVTSVDKVIRSGVKLCLAQAMAKNEKLEEIVSQCTQLGVHQFLFFAAKHSIVKETERTVVQFERLKRIATDAARQSERSDIPEVVGPVSFSQLVEVLRQKHVCTFVGDPRSSQRIIDSVKKLDFGSINEIVLIIGPEGGLHASENLLLESNGANFVNYSPNVLRTETAGLVGMSIIQSFCE